uniref:G protein pathway suppressor 2 n=1 Tax=Plectus sambesii TaxID=2011161 RepID=A0A914WDP4_9BILA
MPSTTLPFGLKPLDPSTDMKHSLQQYIIRQRKKEKEEAAQSAALRQERKEREERQQRDSMTLEKTKEDLTNLQARSEQLLKERHDLFNELKTVINQETEERKRREKQQQQYAREAQEVLNVVGPAAPPTLLLTSADALAPPPPPPGKPTPSKTMLGGSPPHHGLPPNKRPRSPDTSELHNPLFGSPAKISAAGISPFHHQQLPFPTSISGGYSPLTLASSMGVGMRPSPVTTMTNRFPTQHLPGAAGMAIIPTQKPGGLTSGYPMPKPTTMSGKPFTSPSYRPGF